MERILSQFIHSFISFELNLLLNSPFMVNRIEGKKNRMKLSVLTTYTKAFLAFGLMTTATGVFAERNLSAANATLGQQPTTTTSSTHKKYELKEPRFYLKFKAEVGEHYFVDPAGIYDYDEQLAAIDQAALDYPSGSEVRIVIAADVYDAVPGVSLDWTYDDVWLLEGGSTYIFGEGAKRYVKGPQARFGYFSEVRDEGGENNAGGFVYGFDISNEIANSGMISVDLEFADAETSLGGGAYSLPTPDASGLAKYANFQSILTGFQPFPSIPTDPENPKTKIFIGHGSSGSGVNVSLYLREFTSHIQYPINPPNPFPGFPPLIEW